jgi:hypothetical protein
LHADTNSAARRCWRFQSSLLIFALPTSAKTSFEKKSKSPGLPSERSQQHLLRLTQDFDWLDKILQMLAAIDTRAADPEDEDECGAIFLLRFLSAEVKLRDKRHSPYACEENAAILVNCETGRHEFFFPRRAIIFFCRNDIEDPP